jgi:hypothetical protein
MEEKVREWMPCLNLKMPDPQCQQCLWLELNPETLHCNNRQKIICNLYVEEVFGALGTKSIN